MDEFSEILGFFECTFSNQETLSVIRYTVLTVGILVYRYRVIIGRN